MDTNKHIAKALLNKSFAEAKELVFKSLYAKASLALDEARFAVATAVFNEAKTAPDTGVPAGASEDKFTAARATVKKAGYKAKLGKGVPAGAMKEEADITEAMSDYEIRKQIKDAKKDMERESFADSPNISRMNAAWGKIERLKKLLAKIKKAGYKAKLGKGVPAGSMKEEAEQIDEVSPPGMEKMTGSKKTKASFAKQYGKRGKSVMYATAWKLHNKKAQD